MFFVFVCLCLCECLVVCLFVFMHSSCMYVCGVVDLFI